MNAIAAQQKIARKHAVMRAKERHGIRLTPGELATLEDRLRAGQGEVLRVLPDRCRFVRIRLLFDHIVVVFDPELDCIRTVLPRNCREWRERPSTREQGT